MYNNYIHNRKRKRELKSLTSHKIITFILTIVTTVSLYANDISGSLSAGEGSSFIPVQGSAFSIKQDFTTGVYTGEYNVLIRSGNRVIYDQKSETENLYLVFNDRIDDGDIIKLDIISGTFLFEMNPINKLPEEIVDAIKVQQPNEYQKMQPALQQPTIKRHPTPVKPRQTPPTIEEKPLDIPTSFSTPMQSPVPPAIQEMQAPASETTLEEKKSVGFFERLGQIFSGSDAPNEVAPTTAKSSIDAVESPAITQEQLEMPTSSSARGVGTIADIDTASVSNVSMPRTQTQALPNIQSNIDSVAQTSQTTSPRTSQSAIPSISSAIPTGREAAPQIVSDRLSVPNSDLSKIQTEQVPTTQVQERIVDTSIVSGIEQPSFESPGQVEVTAIEPQENVPAFQASQGVVEQAPIEAPSVIQAPTASAEIPQFKKPAADQKVQPESKADKIVITKMIDTPQEDSRVIKRHVEPEAYKNTQTEQPEIERMSDRVVGGGYADGFQTGTVRVKAYSNNKPVSAWVEVFKAGTKERVKTFYTGYGSTLKDIQLPAGVYVIKATYRTSGSKQQRTLGRVTVDEGGNIDKSIAFDDGTILIRAKKGGAPLYAKVEVYEKDSNKQIMYEFTSRQSGIAKLNLATGKYDIVVRDYNNERRFNNVSVRSANTKALNADF